MNPRILLGKPVIKGTRISVELLLQMLSEGVSEDEILDGYPHLVREDVRAAVAYAADVVAHEEFETSQAPSAE